MLNRFSVFLWPVLCLRERGSHSTGRVERSYNLTTAAPYLPESGQSREVAQPALRPPPRVQSQAWLHLFQTRPQDRESVV